MSRCSGIVNDSPFGVSLLPNNVYTHEFALVHPVLLIQFGLGQEITQPVVSLFFQCFFEQFTAILEVCWCSMLYWSSTSLLQHLKGAGRLSCPMGEIWQNILEGWIKPTVAKPKMRRSGNAQSGQRSSWTRTRINVMLILPTEDTEES